MLISRSNSKPQSKSHENAASCKDAIRSGQHAYAGGSYEEALHQFDLAYRLSQGKDLDAQLRALAQKCSVLVKMGNLDAALDSAKMMIRVDKQDARGYYRSASIERLRGDLPAAVKYLEHGKTRVLKSDQLYEYLNRQLTRTKEALSQALILQNPTDPLTVLPLEVLQMVISHLEYDQVVLMLRVSRSWKRVLSRLEPLVTTLDFRKSRIHVSQLMLKVALSRTTHPKTVAFHNVSPSATWQVLKAFKHPSKFAALEYLSVNIPKFAIWKQSIESLRFDRFALKSINIGMECEIGIGQIFWILSRCPLLVEASFKKITMSMYQRPTLHERLTSLELGNMFDVGSFRIPSGCLSQYPGLQSLTLQGVDMADEKIWDLSNNLNLHLLDTYACSITAVQLPSSLEQWLWDGAGMASFFMRPEDLAKANPLPNLHTVFISGLHIPFVMQLLCASQVQNGQLQRLSLRGRGTVTLDYSAPESDLVRGIRHLSIACEHLHDQDIDDFVSNFPKLTTLQLAAPRITGAFIADLLKHSQSQVSKLVLRDCRNVSPDTITWARARGVQVEVILGKLEKQGGRVVREQWF